MEGQKFANFAADFDAKKFTLPILLVEQIASSDEHDAVFKTTQSNREASLLSVNGRQTGTQPLENATVFSFHHFEKSMQTGISVGRATLNKICLPDTAVSKMHASFKLNPEKKWQIVDVESENNTRVNGKIIETGKAVNLKDGDGLTFADTYHCTFFTSEGFQKYLDSLRR